MAVTPTPVLVEIQQTPLAESRHARADQRCDRYRDEIQIRSDTGDDDDYRGRHAPPNDR